MSRGRRETERGGDGLRTLASGMGRRRSCRGCRRCCCCCGTCCSQCAAPGGCVHQLGLFVIALLRPLGFGEALQLAAELCNRGCFVLVVAQQGAEGVGRL